MQRLDYIKVIDQAFKVHPVVGLLGPRQCGKTTLAKNYFALQKKLPDRINYFDLEDPADLERLVNPKLTLSQLSGLIIIDEIQRRPDLFPLLRVLVDENKTKKRKQRWLILGSASRDLIQQSSETLAGRIDYLELTPFNYEETKNIEKLWLRGGFPRSYLAKTVVDSQAWREAYITTFLERDIPSLGIQIPALTLRRFWMMLAHYHGNIFNASEIGCSLGMADTTIRRYLDIFTGTFMVRQLTPWWENIKKRQVKSPKIYFRDSGLWHTLMNIPDMHALLRHPKLGASWEGVALEEVIRHHHATPEQCYFWATHNQAELDLLLFIKGKRLGFEFKYTDAPKLTPSMKIAYETLNLDKLTVIYPGELNYPLAKNIEVKGIQNYLES